MNPSASKAGDARRLDLAAADWLVKRDRGLTAVEQDEFLQWLASDARHGEWFARHQQTWGDFDQLAQWRPEHSLEPNPDLLARCPARPRRSWWFGFAIAAGVAAGFGLWRTAARTPGIAEAYERRVFTDGSIVELNRGAAIDVHYTAGERRVALLQGEAHFTVAKDAARPFVVRAHDVDVRAVGTAFDVRLDPASVEVLVTEGRVALAAPGSGRRTTEDGGRIPVNVDSGTAVPSLPSELRPASSELVAGQRAVVSRGAHASLQIAAVSSAEIARALAWQPPRLLDFSSVPLARVIDEFNCHNRVQIVLADDALAALPIVASLRSDNVEGFVRLLRDAAGIRAEYRAADEIVLHGKEP